MSATICISILLAAILVLVIASMIKKQRKGQSFCGCSCSGGCTGCLSPSKKDAGEHKNLLNDTGKRFKTVLRRKK